MPARLVRPPAALLSTACLSACLAVGLSSLSTVAPAGATPGPEKESPYAAATDGSVPTAAPGTEKESPYAAAKDELALSFGPSLGKLWWLLLPTGLAAGSYLYLRRQEGGNS